MYWIVYFIVGLIIAGVGLQLLMAEVTAPIEHKRVRVFRVVIGALLILGGLYTAVFGADALYVLRLIIDILIAVFIGG